MTRHIFNLAHSLFFITQKFPWYSHSPQISPGQHSAVVLTSTVPHVPPSWRLPVSEPPSTSGYPCDVTLLHVQPYVSHARVLRDTFRNSVTSPSGFPHVFWPISDGLAPSSGSLRLGCTLQGSCPHLTSPVSSDRLAVWVYLLAGIFLPHEIHYKTLLTASTKDKVVCIHGHSACVCCKEATYYKLGAQNK